MVCPGDVVEIVSREGTITGFGTVISISEHGQFKFIAMQGQVEESTVKNVSFSLPAIFPDISPDEFNVSDVQQKLRSIVRMGHANVKTVIPLLSAFHADISAPWKPKALDFDYICQSLDNLRHPSFGAGAGARRGKGVSALSRSARISHCVVDRFSIYLALAYHSLYFVRLGRSHFAAVGYQVMDSVNKVMHALTKVELEQIVLGLTSKRTNPRSGSAILKTFLQHWLLWNDSRLTRAVEAVLEQAMGHSRQLDTPQALSNALSQNFSIDMFPWMETRKSVIANSKNSDLDPVSLSDTAQVSSVGRKQQSHLFTTNLVRGGVFLNESLAASYDPEQSLLEVFIPYIPNIGSVLGRHSSLSVLPRSLHSQQGISHVLPESQIEKSKFRIGVESTAMKLQIRINPRTLQWDERSAAVSKAEFVPIELLSPDQSRGLEAMLKSVPPRISEHEDKTSNLYQVESDSRTGTNYMSSETSDFISMMALHSQAVAGRIAGIILKTRKIEAPFLVMEDDEEALKGTPGIHAALGTSAYVAVGNPFDSSLALLAQTLLMKPSPPPLVYSGSKRVPLIKKLQESLLPGLDLADRLELRQNYWRVLDGLRTDLLKSNTFHIFRCILLEDAQSHDQGQLIPAFCLDLNLNVEVLVPAHGELVYSGDQIICTEILELDPLLGLFVVAL